MTIQFCYLVFITADYYTISNLIIPQFLLKKRYTLFSIAIATIAFLSSWLRALVAVQMNHHYLHPVQEPEFLSLFLSSFFNISFWVLLIIAGKMLIDKARNQKQVEALENEKRKNELDFLKAQINPHALFNSLNTIYGQIDKSNKLARNTLLQFSELLRYQLYDCSSEYVDLVKEITYLENYISFQQLRKNENLIVNISVRNVQENLKIAPLLLIVLIENAFKFVGNAKDKENRITIELSTTQSKLHCSVFNTVEYPLTEGDNSSNGIGLANLKRRLELLYPDKYILKVEKGNDFYKTVLNIELQ